MQTMYCSKPGKSVYVSFLDGFSKRLSFRTNKLMMKTLEDNICKWLLDKQRLSFKYYKIQTVWEDYSKTNCVVEYQGGLYPGFMFEIPVPKIEEKKMEAGKITEAERKTETEKKMETKKITETERKTGTKKITEADRKTEAKLSDSFFKPPAIPRLKTSEELAGEIVNFVSPIIKNLAEQARQQINTLMPNYQKKIAQLAYREIMELEKVLLDASAIDCVISLIKIAHARLKKPIAESRTLKLFYSKLFHSLIQPHSLYYKDIILKLDMLLRMTWDSTEQVKRTHCCSAIQGYLKFNLTERNIEELKKGLHHFCQVTPSPAMISAKTGIHPK